MTQRHKDLARSLSVALAAQGIKLKHAHALHAVAAMHGLPTWNALAARPDTAMLQKDDALAALTGRLSMYSIQVGSEFAQRGAELMVHSINEQVRGVTPETQRTLGEAKPSLEQAGQVTGPRSYGTVERRGTSNHNPQFSAWSPDPLQPADLNLGTMVEIRESRHGSASGLWSGQSDHVEDKLHVALIDPSKVREGQRISLYPNGQHSFVVQKVLKRGWHRTFISDHGSPVDVFDTDDLYLLSTNNK